MSSYRITLLAGDGIGPEITAVARQLLEVVAQQHQFSLSFDPHPARAALWPHRWALLVVPVSAMA